MSKICFGIDIGGTTVKIGVLSMEGELLDKWEIPYPYRGWRKVYFRGYCGFRKKICGR